MPYPLSLDSYVLAEFFVPAPAEWERRLREISPITSNLSHLRFRKFEPRDDWLFPERPIWALYACTPRHMVEPMTAEGYDKHWSEFSLHPESEFPESEQVAQRRMVSDYQHFMWHTQGVMPRLFWLLQGTWGGTPAKYTKRETAYLRGSGALTEPFPIGWFPGCPFDERAVKAILTRDRLMQHGNNLDELEKSNRSDLMKAEDDLAEMTYRETVLDSLAVLHAPAIEFMKSQLGKEEFTDAEISGLIKPAPTGLDRTLSSWKDVYKETGSMPGVGYAAVRKLHAVS